MFILKTSVLMFLVTVFDCDAFAVRKILANESPIENLTSENSSEISNTDSFTKVTTTNLDDTTICLENSRAECDYKTTTEHSIEQSTEQTITETDEITSLPMSPETTTEEANTDIVTTVSSSLQTGSEFTTEIPENPTSELTCGGNNCLTLETQSTTDGFIDSSTQEISITNDSTSDESSSTEPTTTVGVSPERNGSINLTYGIHCFSIFLLTTIFNLFKFN